MRPSPAQWFSTALLLFAGIASAEPLGYASGFRDLYRIDLANGQSTSIGRIGFNDLEGLALSPSGILYAAIDGTTQIGTSTSATTDFLIRINPTTGVGSLVAQLPNLQGRGPNEQLDYGLAFTCDGRLWMSAETTAELWEVNPATAELRLVGNTGASLSGLAGRGTELYGVSVDPNPRLFRIDTNTAAATAIGPLNAGGHVLNVGLDFDAAGLLWATLDPSEVSPSRLAKINLQTGLASDIKNLSSEPGIGIKALAIAAPAPCGSAVPVPVMVPGPAAPLLLLLAGVAGMLGGRRLRMRIREQSL
ncbi:MAG: hypothetical protein ACT4NL_03605 [Pseudomarimonas sp.]